LSDVFFLSVIIFNVVIMYHVPFIFSCRYNVLLLVMACSKAALSALMSLVCLTVNFIAANLYWWIVFHE